MTSLSFCVVYCRVIDRNESRVLREGEQSGHGLIWDTMPTIVRGNRRKLVLVRISGLRLEFWRKDQRFTNH